MKTTLGLRGKALTAALAALACGASHAMDFNGYLRAGPGTKAISGAKQACFNGALDNAIGHGGVGRLGNECDTYGEFTMTQAGTIGGVAYKAVLMPNYYNSGSDIGGSSVGIAQTYVEAKGLDFAPDLSFWGGKRYGDRAAVYFDDYFVVNLTGTGAGVDGIKLGGASLDLAVFRDDGAGAHPTSSTRFNFDVHGVNLNPGGKLRVTGVATSHGNSGSNGAGISLQHDQSGVLGGSNTLWLQYARGSAEATMGTAAPGATSDRRAWRMVETMTWATGPLTGQAMLRFGQFGTDNARVDYQSVAGRVAYAFGKNFKLQAELGTSLNKPKGGQDQRLTKFTLAPTLTVGQNFYDRPELRFYVSRFQWNDAYRVANTTLTQKGKTAAGVQVEIWF